VGLLDKVKQLFVICFGLRRHVRYAASIGFAGGLKFSDEYCIVLKVNILQRKSRQLGFNGFVAKLSE